MDMPNKFIYNSISIDWVSSNFKDILYSCHNKKLQTHIVNLLYLYNSLKYSKIKGLHFIIDSIGKIEHISWQNTSFSFLLRRIILRKDQIIFKYFFQS
jgi:hypothetical protein